MLRCFTALLLLLIGLAHSASAAVTFELVFRLPEGTPSADGVVSALPGQVFAGTEILLRETVSGTETPSFLGEANLNSYSVDVSSDGSDGVFSGLTLNASGGVAGGRNSDSALNFIAIGSAFGQPGREATDLGNGRREALLGTVDLTAPTSGSTTFLLADSDLARDGDFTTFATSAGLESLSTQSGGGFLGGSMTVTAVPEPGSVLALSMLAVGGLVYRRRRMARAAN